MSTELEVNLITKPAVVYSQLIPSDQLALKSLSSYITTSPFSLSSNTTRIKLLQQDSDVSSISISLSLTYFAVAVGSSVNIHDYQSSSKLFSFSHKSTVNSVAFSPDSRLIASGSSDKSIKVFSVITNLTEHEFVGHTNAVQYVMFNRSSNLIVSGGSDNMIIIWDYYSKSIQCTLSGHTSGVNVACFSPDADLVASASNCIKIWGVEQEKELFTLVFDCTFYYCLCFSPCGMFVAAGNSERTLGVWNLRTRMLEMRFSEFESFVYSLCYTFDGNFIISGSADSSVKVWNIKEKREELTLMSGQGQVYTVQISADGRTLLSGTSNKILSICDLQENNSEQVLFKYNLEIRNLKFSRNANFLACLPNDRTLTVWSVYEKTFLFSTRLSLVETHCLEFSANDRWIALGGSSPAILFYSLAGGVLGFSLEGHSSSVKSLYFSSDEKWLISGSSDTTVKVWNLELRKEEFSLNGHTGEVNGVCLTSAITVISGASDKSIKVWDFVTKTLLFDLLGHRGAVLSIHSSSEYAVSTSVDKTLRVWNLKYKREEYALEISDASIEYCFDPNFELFSICYSDAIKVWNLKEKRLELIIKNPACVFTSIHFDHTGESLAVGTASRVVLLYKLRGTEKKSDLCDAYSFDYSKLARVSENSIVIQNTLKLSEKIVVHMTDPVKLLRISPNAEFLLVANTDDSLKIFSILDQSLKLELKGYPLSSWSPSFSESSELILINQSDSCTKAFNPSTSAELPLISQKCLKTVNTLDLSSLYDPGFSSPLSFYNFLYSLSSSQLSKLSGASLDSPFTNLKFTGLHILSSLSQTEAILAISKIYKFTLKTDVFGHTPIYYSIKSYHQDTTDCLLSYLISIIENNNVSIYTPSFFALRNDFNTVIENASSKLHSFLEFCLEVKPIIHFGKPLTGLPGTQVLGTSGSVFEDFSQTGAVEELRPLEYQVSRFPIHAGRGSSGSLSLLKSVLSCENPEIFQTDFIQTLIQSRWDSSIVYIYLFTALIWTNLLTLVLLMDSSLFSLPTLIIFLTINFFLLLWEIIQMIEARIEYFTDAWNLVDALRIALSFTYGTLLFLQYSNKYLLWFTLFFNIVRGLTGFRAFNTTRFYIRLIFQSLFNISSFLCIFIYSNLSFGVLLLACSTNPNLSFESLWANIFNLDLGELGDLSTKEISLNYITFLLACVLNVILMLNMLISILGDSFDEFQTCAFLYNYTEMAQVIIEVEQIKSLFGTAEELLYLHVCFRAYRSGEESWKGKVVDFRKHLDLVSGTVSKGFEKMTEKFEEVKIERKNEEVNLKVALKNTENGLKTGVESKITLLEQKIEGIEHTLSSINEKLAKLLPN